MRQQTHIARYNVSSKFWSHAPLRIAVLADLHACGRWMPLDRISDIVAQANALRPDIVALPGDFLVGHLVGRKPITAEAIASVLTLLHTPFGVYASLGNHDWADCPEAQENGYTRSSVETALTRAGLKVLRNKAAKIANGAYVVGLDSAIGHGTAFRPRPRHDVSRAFATMPTDASVILLAHEPDVFLDQDCRVALQISGHTHCGQVGALGILATLPSRYGTKLDYGFKQQDYRSLIISGGIGYGGIPVRIGRKSEITLTDLRAHHCAQTAAARSDDMPLRIGG